MILAAAVVPAIIALVTAVAFGVAYGLVETLVFCLAFASSMIVFVVFLWLYVRLVLWPTQGCADAVLHAAAPHRRSLLEHSGGILLPRTNVGRASLRMLPLCRLTATLLWRLKTHWLERQYPGTIATQLWEDQNLQRVMFADALARHVLGRRGGWQTPTDQLADDDRFGLGIAIVRLYFGHFFLSLLLSVLMLPLGVIFVAHPPAWLYDISALMLVLWWITLTLAALYRVKPEFELLRSLRDPSLEFFPTSAMSKRASLALSDVLVEARSHVLPTLISVSGTLLLVAALSLMQVLADVH